jgi:hypothetical protein
VSTTSANLPQVVDLTAYKREQYNVLVPTAKLQQISPFHQLRVEEVRINPDPQAGDVYKVGSTKAGGGWQDVLALSKTALLRLAAAAGIVWNWHDTKVLSASRDYVLYQAVGAIRKSSGEWIPIKATKEIDMAVIEEELAESNLSKAGKMEAEKRNGLTPEQWADQQTRSGMIQWRKNKLMRAETGAMLRVVRALLSIKHQYSPAELQRPFVVPRVDFAPDPNDPTVRRMMLEQGARAVGELFGPSAAVAASTPGLPPTQDTTEYRQALGPAIDVDAEIADDDEPENDGSGSSSGPQTSGSAEGPLFSGQEQKGQAGEAPPCDECGKQLSHRELDYSLSKFERPLCYKCQQKGAGSK